MNVPKSKAGRDNFGNSGVKRVKVAIKMANQIGHIYSLNTEQPPNIEVNLMRYAAITNSNLPAYLCLSLISCGRRGTCHYSFSILNSKALLLY